MTLEARDIARKYIWKAGFREKCLIYTMEIISTLIINLSRV